MHHQDNQGREVLDLISPIVKAACRRSNIPQEEEDVCQQVACGLISRLNDKGWTEMNPHFIRRSAFFDALKCCTKVCRQQYREPCLDLLKVEHKIRAKLI